MSTVEYFPLAPLTYSEIAVAHHAEVSIEANAAPTVVESQTVESFPLAPLHPAIEASHHAEVGIEVHAGVEIDEWVLIATDATAPVLDDGVAPGVTYEYRALIDGVWYYAEATAIDDAIAVSHAAEVGIEVHADVIVESEPILVSHNAEVYIVCEAGVTVVLGQSTGIPSVLTSRTVRPISVIPARRLL